MTYKSKFDIGRTDVIEHKCNVGGYFRTEFAFILIKVGHGSRSTNRQTRMRIFAKLSLLRRYNSNV